MSRSHEPSSELFEPLADHGNWFDHKLWQWPRFWWGHGYDSVPDLTGQRVLDFGCGLGGYTISAARAGAEAVGIDVDGPSLRFARHMLTDRFPELAPRVKFLRLAIQDYDDDGDFDYIITHETFEHILDLPSALRHLARLLRPNAVLLASWGPWTGALAGHDLQFYLEWAKRPGWSKAWWPRATTERRSLGTLLRIPIPFSHLMLTNQALRHYGRRYPERPHSAIQDVGSMNGLSVQDYARIIAESPFQVLRWRTNAGKHSAYAAFRLLAGIPGLTEAFTHNIYATMALRDRVRPGVTKNGEGPGR